MKKKIVFIELWEKKGIYLLGSKRERNRASGFSGNGLRGTQLFLKNCFILLTMVSTFREVGVSKK